MTKKELSKWLIDKINLCYLVKHNDYPNFVFLFYDESVIRKIKLCKLNNDEINIDKVTGKCLFYFDLNDKYLMCDYTDIWKLFEENYSDFYTYIQYFITKILVKNISKIRYVNYYNISLLTPYVAVITDIKDLSDNSKFKILK